jgi:hypothetical protein
VGIGGGGAEGGQGNRELAAVEPAVCFGFAAVCSASASALSQAGSACGAHPLGRGRGGRKAGRNLHGGGDGGGDGVGHVGRHLPVGELRVRASRGVGPRNDLGPGGPRTARRDGEVERAARAGEGRRNVESNLERGRRGQARGAMGAREIGY